MTGLALSLILAAHSFSADSLGDPLFARMVGRWRGEGSRVQLSSGRTTRIAARVESRVETDQGAERLRTRSELVETPEYAGGAPRSYVKEYWIWRLGDGRYALGADLKKASPGRFDGSRLVVEQSLAPYAIRSESVFGDGTVEYDELFSASERAVARTRIRYSRD